MTAGLTLILLVSSLTHTRVQTVDLIEINHLHNDSGRHTFSQVIFWDVDPVTQKRHVREWCMIDSVDFDKTPNNMPRVRFKTDGTIVVGWNFRESYSHNDPERDDQKCWPLESRIPLARFANSQQRR